MRNEYGYNTSLTGFLMSYRLHHKYSSLIRSLQADATYLIVNDQNELEKFGLNAVCTHLGCVVPWDTVRSAVACSTRCRYPPLIVLG